MSDSYESSLERNPLVPILAVPRRVADRRFESAPKNLPAARSVAACAFLPAYVALYVGAGYAGIALIERAWSAIFR